MKQSHYGWWKKSKHPGVRYLVHLFNPDRAEFIRLAAPFRRLESKATKPGHIHKVRGTGSKALKRFNRFAWDRKYRNVA